MFYFFQNTARAKSHYLSEELPINDVQGIIVNDSSIFLGLGEYSRIQQYDLNGNFIYAWNTWTYSKDFTFDLDEFGKPFVTTKHLFRREQTERLNAMLLNELNKKVNIRSVKNQQILSPKEIITIDGIRYFVMDGFNKKLLKTIEGKTFSIIDQSLILNSQSGTINSWLTAGLGILIFFGINIFLFSDIQDKGNGEFRLDIMLETIFSVK